MLCTTRRGFLTACGTLAVTGVAGAHRTHPQPTFATYNITDLTTEQVQSPGDEQAAAAARVIQEVRPDVLALNELVNNEQKNGENAPSNVRAFIDNYLNRPQADHLDGIDYPYSHAPPSNTGVHSGMDLDNNGTTDGSPGDRSYGNDAFGFGQ